MAFPKFAPLSLKQQKRRHNLLAGRRLRAQLNVLRAAHRGAFDAVKRFATRIEEIDAKIAKVEDRIADEADKTYGGWNVWRHDAQLLARVTALMQQETAELRAQKADLQAKSAKVQAPYLAAKEKLEAECRSVLA